jgi:hypothetical protein
MERHQVGIIDQQAQKLGLGQGEVFQLANQIAGQELASLYDLDRAQADQLIVALDNLLAAAHIQ